MTITLPIFIPIFKALDLDPVWICIMILLCLSIGQLSSPFGLVLFVMETATPPEINMRDIYHAAGPHRCLAGFCLPDSGHLVSWLMEKAPQGRIPASAKLE